MVKKKSGSKRQTLRQKHNARKRMVVKNRELRKEARKEAASGKKRALRKDPGIPNLWPFKEKLLNKIAQQKESLEKQKEELKERRKVMVREKRAALKAGIDISELANSATERSTEFNLLQEAASEEALKSADMREGAAGQSNRKTYFRQLKQVIKSADVILEVLDARDPEGCRARMVERSILSVDSSKKIILVLNKIDLVPRENVKAWLKSLRNEFPTIAFKAATMEQNGKIGQVAGDALDSSESAMNGTKSVGSDTLMQLLKNYSRSHHMKTAITVGVMGYPNVGKSSIINSLKRSKVAGVSATAGFTKALQEVQLDKKIKLIDCPGVIFGDDNKGAHLLRNCVSVEMIEDPVAVVNQVIRRVDPTSLLMLYQIPRFETADDFLNLVAKKTGKLGKGGVPHRVAAARTVLQDWNSGKLPFYSEPPKIDTGVQGSSKVVSGWGKEFDLDAVFAAADSAVIEGLPTTDADDYLAMNTEIVPDNDDEMMDMDSDDEDVEM